MHFVAVLKESGGCDYTIGCGIRVATVPERITDKDEAVQWLYEQSLLHGTEGGKLSSCTLLQVESSEKIDLGPIYETAEAKMKEAAAKREEESERALLKKLQEKWGG